MPQRCPCGCDQNVPLVLSAVASAAESLIEILGLDSGAGQFVRDDAIEYELWLAKAAPALVKQLRPAPLPVPYSPGESPSVTAALLSALDDDDLEHRLAHTS